MKKMFFLLIPLTATAFSLSAKPNTKVVPYIAKYRKIATADKVIPFPITMAQAIIESQCGRSSLALRANNHFGIRKPHSKHYKVYKTVIESYTDHARILKKYYASLLKLDKDDYKGWAWGLQRLKYATDRHYAEKLIKCIDDNQLASKQKSYL
jgi:flagellum-specific peptidoglycan hydrolase FlgJ